MIEQLASGFGVALKAQNLAAVLGGAVLGVAVGRMSSAGVAAVLAVLLPMVHAWNAAPALIFLGAVYCSSCCGTQHRAGRGAALVTFAVGFTATLAIALAAEPLNQLAQRLGPADWAALIVLSLVAAVVVVSGSLLRGMGTLLFGLLVGQIGTDPVSGAVRYTLGIVQLEQGVGLVALAVGLFAIAPAIAALGASRAAVPNPHDPHDAPDAASLRLRVPQPARDAATRLLLIPLLSLGLPLTAPLALLYGAIRLQGLNPGAQWVSEHAALFWGLVASLWVGSVALLLLTPLSSRLGVKQRADRLAWPLIVVFGTLGLATLGATAFDLWIAAGFAMVGYVFHQLGCPPAAFLLGFLLGPSLEVNLRRALLLSDGSWSTFVTRPLSSGLLVAAALLFGLALLPPVRKWHERVLKSG